MNQEEKQVQERNHTYFTDFIRSRGSVSYLKLSFAGLAISLLNLYAPYVIWTTIENVDPFSQPFYQFLVAQVIFFLVCFIVSFFDSLIYRFQKFFAMVNVLHVFLLLLSLLVLAHGVAVYHTRSMNLGSLGSIVYIVSFGSLYLASVIYNIFWLRKTLQEGVSEERILAQRLGMQISKGPKHFLTIFGVTMIGGALARGEIGAIVSYPISILLTVVFSRLHVEYVYATILRWKYDTYQEEYVSPSKSVIWTRIRILIELTLFFLLFYVGMVVLPENHPLIGVCRVAIVVMIIYGILRLMIRKGDDNDTN